MESGSDDPSELARGRRAVLSAHLATDRCSFGLTPALERSSALSLEASRPSVNLGGMKFLPLLFSILVVVGIYFSFFSLDCVGTSCNHSQALLLIYFLKVAIPMFLWVSILALFIFIKKIIFLYNHLTDRTFCRLVPVQMTRDSSYMIRVTLTLRRVKNFDFHVILNTTTFQLHFRGNRSYVPNPRLSRVLDILFILLAEHEMNCSTAAVRHLASSLYFTVNLVYL
ncbi:unnamed protein product [Musa acuminata var. zebrina]